MSDSAAAGRSVSDPSTAGLAPWPWLVAMHDASDADQVLELLAAAVLQLEGASRVHVLRRDEREGVLAGWLSLSAEDARGLDLLGGGPERWLELARLGECETVSPEPTGLLRCLRLPLSDGENSENGDAAATCLEGLERRWSEGLGRPPQYAAAVRAGEVAWAWLAVEEDESEGLGAHARETAEHLRLHAGRAAEHLHARSEARYRRAQLVSLSETARAVFEGSTPESGLRRLLQNAGQSVDARGGLLWIVEGERTLRRAADFGVEAGEDPAALATGLERLVQAVAWRRECPVLERAGEDSRITGEARHLQSLVAVPLVTMDRVRGVLLVFGKRTRRLEQRARFTAEDRDLLVPYANLAAMLLDQSRLGERAAAAERRLETATHEAMRLQFLADLGSMSVQLGREMSTPLASVSGFARRVHRALEVGDPNREYLEIVMRESARLERMVGEHLQFASLNRPRLAMSNLNQILATSLAEVSREIEGRRVRLLKRLSPQVPMLLLDEEMIRQAFVNVLRSLLEILPASGRLQIESRSRDGVAVVEIGHDGPPLAGEALEQLFVPFASGGRPGGGIGLAAAQRIVRDHGGEIGIRSDGEHGQVFLFRLPIRENGDRRRGPDRRHRSPDRRGRLASSAARRT